MSAMVMKIQQSGQIRLNGNRYIPRCFSGLLFLTLQRATFAAGIFVVLTCASFIFTQRVSGEDSVGEGVGLLQQEPYDLIVIKDKGGEVKVKLLDFPGRTNPKKNTGVIIVEPLSHPGMQFEVSWGQIENIDTWEERLQREASERIKRKDFNGAFPYVAVLMRDFPRQPGLIEMRTELVYQNALDAYSKGDSVRTLALMEELKRFNPRFRPEAVDTAISRLTDRMLQDYLDKGKLEVAQLMLKRLSRDYSPEKIASIPTWIKKFRDMAEAKKAEAISARDAGNFRAAREFAKEMLYIDPTVPQGKELLHEIDIAYPMVRVGVMQKAVDLDPTRIENSAARRSGRLVYRSLFEMLGAGIEGGEYLMPLGKFELSEDQLQLRMFLQPNRLPPPFAEVNAFDLADLMIARANPKSHMYNPAWAGVLKQVSVPGPGEVVAELRRPHVLPQAMMQIRLDDRSLGMGDSKAITGKYLFQESEAEGVVFRFAGPGEPAKTQPREIYEITQPSGEHAITALMRGEIDIIDQLFPADAQRLRQRSEVKVVDYPLPTVHVLVPWSDHPFVNDRTTKRGMLLAINRELILTNELTGGNTIRGCQVISGPVPAGVDPDDPLGYAYDTRIEPARFQPRLGALLIELRKRQWAQEAEKKKEAEPKYRPIKIAYPANEIARVACDAISQQLQAIKLEVELIELPDGVTQPEPGSCDLCYMIVAMWEPTVDARRLLGPDGLAKSNDQMIGMALRQIEAARNWKEVRDGLLELHRIAHAELPVLPLYQLLDSFAYRNELKNTGTGIVSLYQNIANWRIDRQ